MAASGAEPLTGRCQQVGSDVQPGRIQHDSAWGLANVQRVINTRAKAALIEFAINDGFAGNAMSLETSLANTRAIVQAVKTAAPPMAVFLVTTNPVLDDRPNLASYYAQYATAASLEGVGLINNRSGWPAANYTDMPDGVHPTLSALLQYHVPNIVSALKPLVG